MVEEKVKETTITSSGSAWQVMVIIAGMLLLFFVGYKRSVTFDNNPNHARIGEIAEAVTLAACHIE
jgi:hypothetical protein